MSLEVADLQHLDVDRVDLTLAKLTAILKEEFPDVEFDRGVVQGVVLRLASIIAVGVVDENVEIYRRSTSLQLIEANPTAADDALVDLVLGNYRVTRRSGQPATGNVTIIVDRLTPVTIASGAAFLANGTTFVTEAAYSAKTTAGNVVVTTDRLLTLIGGGQYAFSIPVVATTDGVSGMLRRGTKVEPDGSIPNFVTAYAESDFLGGVAADTNATLITRLQEGAAVKALSNRTTNLALIRNQVEFQNVLAVSEVGYGDPEMRRDQHWLFPVSGGGRVDFYLRSQALPQSTTLTKTATLVEKTVDGGIWQFAVELDDAPGFYRVDRVALPDELTATSFEVVSVVRDVDLVTQDDQLQPDIQTAQEGAFSRYQTAVVRFLDTVTDVTDLTVYTASQAYTVALSQMPLVAELQAFLTTRGTRPPSHDVLVRAAIPCFLRISFNIHKLAAMAAPDTVAMAQAIADRINTAGFITNLHTSIITETAHKFLTVGMAISRIDLRGTIIQPDGEPYYLHSTEVLSIPQIAAISVSGRTVAFIMDPADIGIAVINIDATEV